MTLDAVREKLLDTHGGYLTVRYANGVRYLDWLADFDAASVQTVEFGKNLLDVKISRDHTERAAALIPLGARITDEDGAETEERVTIASVNDGENYIFDETAVAEIGWIWRTEIWENVTMPANLLRKARARLAELVSGVTSMELTIVDEADTGADIGDIHARQYVDCSSPPHGISGRYLCVSRTRDYLHLAGNTVAIGASGITLTSLSARQGTNLSALEDDVLGQTSKIETISEKVDAINGSKMYRTELVTDGVSVFRDKGQSAVLRCRVYSWDTDITDTLDASAEELTALGIKTPGGKDKWHQGTVKNILQNEKYKGCALLQKSYTADFLTKKQVPNHGEVPQYYVEDNHECCPKVNTNAPPQKARIFGIS